MLRMARVYLDTSFYGAAVSTRTTPRSIVWRETSRQWLADQGPRHELFVSDEVIAELADPGNANRDAAMSLLTGISVLDLTPEVRGFAKILVEQKVMPGPSVAGDAIHVAVATVHRMDFLLSWNVKHLANPNKRAHLAAVCLRMGLTVVQIVTPDLLQE